MFFYSTSNRVLAPSYESWKHVANYLIYSPIECFDEDCNLAVYIRYTESNLSVWNNYR